MPVVIVQQGPTLTQEKYDQVVNRLTGKDRMESPSDWPAEGLLVHATGDGADGFRVVDVWASEAAFREFGETLIPILDDMGVTDLPEVYPAHSFVSA
jgi:hypothetical protein